MQMSDKNVTHVSWQNVVSIYLLCTEASYDVLCFRRAEVTALCSWHLSCVQIDFDDWWKWLTILESKQDVTSRELLRG